MNIEKLKKLTEEARLSREEEGRREKARFLEKNKKAAESRAREIIAGLQNRAEAEAKTGKNCLTVMCVKNEMDELVRDIVVEHCRRHGFSIAFKDDAHSDEDPYHKHIVVSW